MTESNKDTGHDVNLLFDALKKALPQLKILLDECNANGKYEYEDGIYRFYHQSYKVYNLQGITTLIVKALYGIAPERPLNKWFMTIIKEGTEKGLKPEDNHNWLEATRPILEAFFHAQYFLEMAVKYGEELKYPPKTMPSGWAAFLYLYNLR